MGCGSSSSVKQLVIYEGTILLPIPPRLQWDSDGGYCGQTSVQCCSLYYGNYISQAMARTAAGSELLVSANAQAALEKLGYNFQVWDTENRQQPQYRDYLQWIKANIKKGFPVIITGFSRQGHQLEYDHIYLAMGVKCRSEEYSGDDNLIYGEGYNKDYVITAFDKIADTREMKENGKSLDFAIPKDRCFGIAIKGIKDEARKCLPVRISIEENSEPNIREGKQLCKFTLKIQVSYLKSGKRYDVLKFSTLETIPKNSVEARQASNVTTFTASGEIYQFEDTVESNGIAFYRCIQHNGGQEGYHVKEQKKKEKVERGKEQEGRKKKGSDGEAQKSDEGDRKKKKESQGDKSDEENRRKKKQREGQKSDEDEERKKRKGSDDD